MGKKYRNKLVEHKVLPDGSSEDTFVQEEVIEPAAVEEQAAPAPEEEIIEEHKVDFDGWYGARASKIPGHHHKEIIKADFKGRKMPVMATMAEFDAALKKYGVSLA